MAKRAKPIEVRVTICIKPGQPAGASQMAAWSRLWRKLLTSVQEKERPASIQPAQGEKKRDPNNQNYH